MDTIVFLLTIFGGFFVAIIVAKYIWSAIVALLKLIANLLIVSGLVLVFSVIVGVV